MWVPTDSVLVVRVARPPALATTGRLVAPSEKTTEDPGLPTPGATTLIVAFNVTAWPNAADVVEADSAIAVVAFTTVTGTRSLVLPCRSLPSR